MNPILDVRGLSIGFTDARGAVSKPVVREVSFCLERGRVLGIVGESGSGKSLTALAIMRLLPAGARVLSGNVHFDGTDLSAIGEEAMRGLRGRRVAMLFQDPLSSFNPLQRIGRQIGEALSVHKRWKPARIRERVAELLRQVGLDEPARFMAAFPHQLSGGQRQRAMLAMALANEPDLLIADEPTTALDAAVQQQVLDLLLSLRRSMSLSLVVISHDLSMMRRLADEVCVMHDGGIVEQGETRRLFESPGHAYTRVLLDQGGDDLPAPVQDSAPVALAVRSLSVRFPLGNTWLGRARGYLQAVREVSFELCRGECLGVVGESGSGKSSLGLAVLRLIGSSGEIRFGETALHALNEKQLRPLRKRLQIVFQDPLAALNPRLSVRDCIAEGLGRSSLDPEAVDRRVMEAMREVELDPAMRHRYPHEFSGGQCQRICLARALVMAPECIVFDEPTSSLDRNTQFQVLRLLRTLQERHGLASLFITHDLALVRRLCQRVMIMQAGRVVESGPTEEVFAAPRHAYTRRLLTAAMLAYWEDPGCRVIEQGVVR